jgi:hypothetical protein
VFTILADSLATFAASFTRFFGGKLMGGAFFVGCLATFAGNFTLLLFIH